MWLGHFSAEGFDDGFDVVTDHAGVGAVGSSGGAHGVREKFATDFDGVAFRRGTLTQAFDVFWADGTFDENRRNFAVDERADEVVDALEAGFAFGRDALNAQNFNAVGAAEILEGVMRGDHHALLFGNGVDRSVDFFVEFGELLAKCVGVGLENTDGFSPFGSLWVWSESAKTCFDGAGGEAP